MNLSSIKVPLLAILSCLLWSTAFVGIKIGLQYTSPLQFAGIRFFLAGLLLLPFSGSLQKNIYKLRYEIKTILKVAFFQTSLLYALFYYGISLLPGALSAIIIGSQPLFAAIVAHLFINDDKMGIRKTLTITSGIAGIILIATQKSFSDPDGLWSVAGIILLILANIASGLGNVVVSKNRDSISPVLLNSVQMIIGGFILFLVSLITEPFQMSSKPMEYYGALIWLSILSAVAFSIWFMLLQKPGVKVSDLNIYKFIIPVFGAILSWTLLPDESPDILSVSGMVIIGASIIAYTIQTRSQLKK